MVYVIGVTLFDVILIGGTGVLADLRPLYALCYLCDIVWCCSHRWDWGTRRPKASIGVTLFDVILIIGTVVLT